jgi:hypothetical protein
MMNGLKNNQQKLSVYFNIDANTYPADTKSLYEVIKEAQDTFDNFKQVASAKDADILVTINNNGGIDDVFLSRTQHSVVKEFADRKGLNNAYWVDSIDENLPIELDLVLVQYHRLSANSQGYEGKSKGDEYHYLSDMLAKHREESTTMESTNITSSPRVTPMLACSIV